MTARAVRSLALATALLTTTCSGSSTPPPPDPSPKPARSADGLRPLTSREGTASAAGPAGAASTLPPGHPPIEGAAPTTSGTTSPAGRISGTISVAPALTVGPGDILYVMAKKDGSTLAVRRVEAPSFPYAFEVSEGHAMVAGIALEGPVDIVARISRTGDAIPSPGDLEGTTPNVPVPSTGVAVLVDRVLE